jgi:hypothetical protein
MSATDEEKKRKRDEKRKKYNDPHVCKNCGKKHPSKAEDECWELEKNKDSRPVTWKLSKSTWRCAGSLIETETRQPGVVRNKVNTNHTYLEATHYWTPLNDKDDNDDKTAEVEINMIKELATKEKRKGNKWTWQIERRKEQQIIIDSGATSHFISEDMNLPTGGKSDKQVYLPNNTTLRTSTKTKLPFPRLSEAAREADVLPGLKQSLMSVNKMSDEGYTTIFHPREEGVTINQEGTISITMMEPSVLFGHKLNGEKLWTVPARSQKHKREEANNAYSLLPSIPQSIKYLHTVAGFPVKETWITAIQTGNYVT